MKSPVKSAIKSAGPEADPEADKKPVEIPLKPAPKAQQKFAVKSVSLLNDPVWPARMPMAVGVLALLALVGGLGFWAVDSQIAGAVMAPGTIQVESNRQVVQHPDGGVVGQILAHDGDKVKAGDVVMRLDGSRTQSELSIAEGQLRDLAARQARLEAERDNLPDLVPSAAFAGPDFLGLAFSGPDFEARLASERSLFRARLEALSQETNLLKEQSAQLENRIAGTRAQLGAVNQQATLLSAGLADQKALLAQGLTQSSHVMDTERELANIQGQAGQISAQIADLRGQISANAISVLQLQTKRREEAVTQLRDIQAKSYELAEQRLALKDTLSRLEIRAPVSGIVYGSKFFAEQSVVQRAEAIMYIIPQDQPLVVAARVDATHIDEIHVGQPVSLRFTAFDQRETQPVDGTLTQISADVVTDEATHQSYYAVRIVPDMKGLVALGDKTLVPGMPVEAFITTGDRSPLSYLIHPFAIYFDRAFRE